jgi:hypothetical protein
MTYLNKTSTLVPSQLPEFIRDDPNYQNFVLFLQAYYEWMEQQGGAVYESKNLKNYSDIDNTLNDFLIFYKNEFLPFFPDGSLVDQRKLTKIARELYKTKGTPASYQFLFRVLYNTDVELYNAKDYILRASDGKWTITRLLNLFTSDPAWLSTTNYRLFGETSKGYATIEEVILSNNTTQVVLSGIDRNFTTGEFVRVIDNHGADVIINSANVRAQILGVISSVSPDQVNSGSAYNVGDPVVFYGGLNPAVSNPVGASGFVSQVTSASIIGAKPIYKGQGYRSGSYTHININSGSGLGSNAQALATTFDTANPYYVTLVPNDTISPKTTIHLNSGSYNFANLINANINTRLVDALSFPVLNTFGISAVTVTSGGSGYDATTTANAVGYYTTDSSSIEPLPSLGILGPIQITAGGLNYNLNDKIVFSGGSGYGAFANVTSVAGNGAIQAISFVYDPSGNTRYPLGGMGYQNGIPNVSVSSGTGAGASIYVPGLVGGDATFSLSSTTYGQVMAITLTNAGKDYISTPNVSLRVEDLLVTNVYISNQPKAGNKIYQGTLLNQTFFANVDSILIYSSNNANTLLSTYNLRVYDYNGVFDANASIYVSRSGADTGANIQLVQTTAGIYTQGRKIYGNGAAKATVNFTNGIQYGSGFYQNADGQPSAYSILENQDYNNYAYILQVEEALAKYKDTALAFLHPAGMKYNTFNLLKNNVHFNAGMTSEELNVQKLASIIGTPSYVANVASGSSNTINFNYLSGANIANAIPANSFVTIYPNLGAPFYSLVKGGTANTITLKDTWVTSVPNVAIATAAANSTTINISSLTNAWNIATGNIVSYISDFINIYDYVSFDGLTYKQVVHVDQPGFGTTIKVASAYPAAQSGYLSFTQNVISSNVVVSGITQVVEVIDISTEDGFIITTEDSKIIILG